MVVSKQDIFSSIINNKNQVKSFGVRNIGLFGSYVRGEQNDSSDIDILVEFEKEKKTFDNFMQLSYFLEDVLEHSVELVTSDSLSPYLRPHIDKEVEYVDFTH